MTGSVEINTTEGNYTNGGFDMTVIKILEVSYIVVLSGIFFLGITGNGLVIWFVAFRMKKTVNSVWFLSLAFADFTFCLLQPLTITHVALDGHWPFGTFMCKLNRFSIYLNLSASVLQLTVISIDRCISVVFPVWCQNHRTVRLAVKVVLVLWIVSLLLNVSYFTNTYIYDTNYKFVYCFEDWVMDKVQIIIRFIVLFVIAFTIIIFCYTLIFLRIQRNRRATSTKPFKVIAAVIISFFICWFPYHVFSIMDAYGSNTWQHNYWFVIAIGRHVTSVLAYSNSCVNPLLYVFIGQDFKQKFWSAIKSAFERTFIEDANMTDPNPNRHLFLTDHAMSQM
ncbi:formyl peptide receptor 2-like [Rana temporaria]|uniref:formyl peptide receptor 2-like n=1 Tax=Rana temporaria TaxID=8407 RepID=UPI001AAD9696|nr:formyl peptide receptor 2-like [Rana temporaria]